MQSNNQDVEFHNTIKKANDLAYNLQIRLARYRGTLRSIEKQEYVRPTFTESTWSTCSDKSAVKDTNECCSLNVNTTEIPINCPNCTVQLGIQVKDQSEPGVLKQNSLTTSSISPDDSGDKLKFQSAIIRNQLNSMHLPTSMTMTSKNDKMSYTILKECTSSPVTTAYRSVRDKDGSAKSKKASSFYSDNKNSGRSRISQKPSGRTIADVSTTSKHECGGNNAKRSHSFTVTPTIFVNESALRNLTSNAKSFSPTPKTIASNPTFHSIPIPVKKASDRESLQNIIDQYAIDKDISTVGIDKVEVAPLYESSSDASCDESECEDKISTKYSLSHSSPTSDEISSPDLLNASSMAMARIGDDDATKPKTKLEDSEPRTSREDDFLNYDIPEFRQDLYKDCFTLFVEKWFGRQGS